MAKSNLFHVDIEKLEQLLAEANDPLVQTAMTSAQRLHAFLKETPPPNDERLSRAKSEISSKAKDLRANRLGDAKPFKEAVKCVEAYFKPVETAIAHAQKALTEEIQGRIAARATALEAASHDNGAVPVVTSRQSTIVSSIAETAVPSQQHAWDTVLRPETVDRRALSGAQLVPFLTDYQILQAAKRALAENPSLRLRGIGYAVVPK